jgi:hypothetical protein
MKQRKTHKDDVKEEVVGETVTQTPLVEEYRPKTLEQRLVLTTLWYTVILFSMLFMIVGILYSARGYNFPLKLLNGMKISVFHTGVFSYRYLAPVFNPIFGALTGRSWPIGRNPTFEEAVTYGSFVMLFAFISSFWIRIKLILNENNQEPIANEEKIE